MNQAVVLAPPEPAAVHQTLAARNTEVEARVLQAYKLRLEHVFKSGLALLAVGGFGNDHFNLRTRLFDFQ